LVVERSIVREKPRRTSGQNRQLKLLLFTAVCIVLIALAAYFFLWPKEEVFYLANFTYGEVELRDFHSWVNSAGKMSPKKLLDISIPFEGIIEKWVVEPGQPVEKDDILLSINGQALYEKIEETREKVADYEKRLKRFKIEEGYELLQREQEEKVHSNRIEKAQEHLDLTEELYKLDLVALNDFSSAKDSLEVALGEYERYKMNRELRDIQQENSKGDLEKMFLKAREELKELEELALQLDIKAPSDGYILDQKAEAGDEFRKNQT
ncbi:MAG: hypothetical protein GX801_12185, partial [Fibrobacter sp.]|nr:hypothetical protein [Fibrobacter sp.]